MEKIIKGPKGFAVAWLAQVLIAGTATGAPDLNGMWSDPPPRAEDAFCHVGCVVEARERLTELLDDPANLDRTLRGAASGSPALPLRRAHPQPSHPRGARELPPSIMPRIPLSPQCAPWGFTRQILSPHAMEITQFDDRVTLYYSEWTATADDLPGRQESAGEPGSYPAGVLRRTLRRRYAGRGNDRHHPRITPTRASPTAIN